MNVCSPNSSWVCSVSFVVSHCKLSEFWPITCKMLSVEVVRRAAHEYILFFLQTQAKFRFLFPSVRLNRRTAAFRWYRTHWELLLLQSYFMRTSEVTNWGIYLFFSFFQLLNLQKLVMWKSRTRETSRLLKRNHIWKIAQSSVIKRATRR